MKRLVFLCAIGLGTMLMADRPLGLTSLEQEFSELKLQIQGEIPTWLTGTFVRNGPAKFNVGEQYVDHWFDGLAMLHAFHFHDGAVTYTNKFLRTTAFNQVFKKQSLNFAGFKQKTTNGQEEREASLYIPNANVNVAMFANQYLAMTEVPSPVIFDLQTLTTEGLLPYADDLPKDDIWECAHPHYDPLTQETINYFIEFGEESIYCIYRLKKGSSLRQVIARIGVDEPSYMHSFAVTKKYIVLTEFPFVVNPIDLLNVQGAISAYRWIPGRPMRILVINRSDGKLVGQFKADPVFAFHHINTFEDANELIIDLSAYPDASCITNTDGKDLQNKRVARFARYRLSLATRKVIKEQLGPAIEMPRINYACCNGKPYEYVYGLDDSESMEEAKKRDIIKIDVKTKKLTVWTEEGCFASEPVFVASPNAKGEDDGVLLSVVLDTENKRSFLLVLRASTLKEQGRAILKHHIPFGLHGDYFTAKRS